ncbi:MAG: ribonuclease HII [Liquorilactobacillus nagelii]|jgi:ribonuclease HII|uniref:Ribonuclease HII n=1 Tax=Liquorilactobacillus nagelii TaxID=82688 RepID=A0A3Q8CUS9_9LACO|nr:ribonuclease HII [Liquorilactobacillus nagelii]AUJ32173.1 ribonuclease HII [Liquorilactobacillus nagelii]KRL40921.1 ribonuclease HII [Liquorilactobacillus nagelii DSM 13675]MCC7615341.1 ribonuclease HII [Liquorilactobacillus nagelii]MCP9315955.1 ribonuclease HII [Liquorilactobacillus nagelii]QYH53880.1 ribonuclease HII [Liquorilactobacillus nagelii DSM 13675]
MENKQTIRDIKSLLRQTPSEAQLDRFKNDSRKGVQQLLEKFYRCQLKQKQQQERFDERFKYERTFWEENKIVAGIDEVGRGPLAGPVVAAAVILPPDFAVYQVNDSKQLSHKLRESLYSQILLQAQAVGIGVVDNTKIDRLNIYQATRVAMKQAVNNLSIKPQQLIIDAMQIDSPISQLELIKADAQSNSVAAASIVAKVWRDHLMEFYDQIYPGYSFSANAGYGTAAHLLGLKEHGVTPIHRQTFAPVTSFLKS